MKELVNSLGVNATQFDYSEISESYEKYSFIRSLVRSFSGMGLLNEASFAAILKYPEHMMTIFTIIQDTFLDFLRYPQHETHKTLSLKDKENKDDDKTLSSVLTSYVKLVLTHIPSIPTLALKLHEHTKPLFGAAWILDAKKFENYLYDIRKNAENRESISDSDAEMFNTKSSFTRKF